nr:hypothetical protein [Flavobacteriaceae bacterium]
VMLLINPWAFVFAFGLEALILIYLFNRKFEQKWGDAAAGVWMQLSRFALLRLNAKKIHPRNWRPIIILFIDTIADHLLLVKFTEMLGQNSGVLTICKLVTPDDTLGLFQKNELAFQMQRELETEGLQALTEVNVVDDFKKGMYTVAASHGMAGLKTNTVVFGWSHSSEGKVQELEIIDLLAGVGKNILVVDIKKAFTKSVNKRIDVWWGGRGGNGDLMLLLAYLIRLNTKWKKAKINIFSIVADAEEKLRLTQRIQFAVKEARIEAKVNLLLKENDHVTNIIAEKSKHADLVFVGLAHDRKNIKLTIATIDALTANLKAVVFAQNNGMTGETPVIFGSSEV